MFCLICGMLWWVSRTSRWRPFIQSPVIRDRECLPGIRGLALERIDDGHFLDDLVRILMDVPVFDEIGDERMEPVDRYELFGEIEWRAEMIDTSVGRRGFADVVVWCLAA